MTISRIESHVGRFGVAASRLIECVGHCGQPRRVQERAGVAARLWPREKDPALFASEFFLLNGDHHRRCDRCSTHALAVRRDADYRKEQARSEHGVLGFLPTNETPLFGFACRSPERSGRLSSATAADPCSFVVRNRCTTNIGLSLRSSSKNNDPDMGNACARGDVHNPRVCVGVGHEGEYNPPLFPKKTARFPC